MRTTSTPSLPRSRPRTPGSSEFHQAVREVAGSLLPVLLRQPRYLDDKILERLVEPDRTISFGVNWVDDRGEIHVNRGYRVQMSSSIGPYKGGLRFHPSVDAGLLKFLGLEQTLKNSLTTLPMGGAKGGSDFDPKGRSESEIRRFCQSFMTELHPYIGEFTDVPAGDIGVGEREIGYLFGQYKRIAKRFAGAITGKGIKWGGSRIRQEATGYGVGLLRQGDARHAWRQPRGQGLPDLGQRQRARSSRRRSSCTSAPGPLTLSDSDGFVHDPDGIDAREAGMGQGAEERAAGPDPRVRHPLPARLVPSRPPPAWPTRCGRCRPTAPSRAPPRTRSAQPTPANLVGTGVRLVAEGSNMPTVPEGVERFLAAGLLYAPSKAANAGGVAVSGLEMAQDMQLSQWTAEEVDDKLQTIMRRIHDVGAPGGRGVRVARQLPARRQHRRVRQGGRRHAGREPGVR